MDENRWYSCSFSDLKNSTGISFDKQDRTMTKLLEYLNNPFIEIHNNFGAEFVEIKRNGGIIYSKENAIKALLAISIKACIMKDISLKGFWILMSIFWSYDRYSKRKPKTQNIGQRGLNFPV